MAVAEFEKARYSEREGTQVACPACRETMRREAAVDIFGKYKLYGCSACGLQFWYPGEMPDAAWYEQVYGARDQKVMPLEPGHLYFLRDPFAPNGGELLDIGCGTGNFLVAAQRAGYRVTGTELDRNAARYAKEKMGIQRVVPFSIFEFVKERPKEFDVVTFFEVLEHQTDPVGFIQAVKTCLKPGGTVALSVPNRDRWLTGVDNLDFPPNHFLRWNADALIKVLESQGFKVLSTRQQPADFRHTAQMINMALRTGITKVVTDGASPSFREVIQMTSKEARAALERKVGFGPRMLRVLGRIKQALCYPLAIIAYPYVRLRGYKGTYLYCLARLPAQIT